MKNSQIILGASAFVLAIAGAFATKANNRTVQNLANVLTSPGSCRPQTNTSCATANPGVTCKTANVSSARSLVTSVNCHTPFRTEI